MNTLINWSEVSRQLTGDRTRIRADYSGKKYSKKVNSIKRMAKIILKIIENKCKN